MRMKYPVFVLIILFFFNCKKQKEATPIQKNKTALNQKEKVFTKINASESGIHFENRITEDLNTLENLFNYDYFYNGAGVGLEDINNDGLLDVFFCGNQVQNKLYLNKGNLVFEDISDTALVNNGKNWSNGVAFVDINEDGWMDIYVSQGGPNKRLQRKNLLYINQKDNTFSEEAEKYGLADMGISTQSAFFDYDNDGDLDCLVMNENEYYGVDPVNLYKLIENNPEAQYFNSSHLYQNDNGVFKDVTRKAGIERPIFGLGLTISDINNDNLLDIYIASDYYIPDALFINQGNGTFKDLIKEYTRQISFYGMGMDIEDINNDNLQDIFVLDMASSDHVRSKTLMASMSTARFEYLVDKADFHHQYMYNSLQLNIGNNKFNNVAQLSNTANTDWSWSVLMTDFDLDEDKDIYITNGYRKYALDNDLQNKVYQEKIRYKGNVPLQIKQDLYHQMPSERLPNILFENKGNLKFKNNALNWGLADFTFSNGAVQGDLDNDGDLDLIVNNIDDLALVYKNTTRDTDSGNYLKISINSKLSEGFPKTTIYYDGKSQFIESKRIKGYRSSHPTDVIFGLGDHQKIDSMMVSWPNGNHIKKYDLKANQMIVVGEDVNSNRSKKNKKNNTLFKLTGEQPDFTHNENGFDDFQEEILLPYRQSTQGPFISKADVNGDGLEDFYIGNSTGAAGELYLQSKYGFIKKEVPEFEKDKGFEDMESVFFDYDLDGDQDLYVVSGGYEFDSFSSYYTDRIYINDGKGNFVRTFDDTLTKQLKNGKTVTKLDFDNDGDYDLFIGNHYQPQKYPRHEYSTLYENQNGKLVDVTKTKAIALQDFGPINKALATDYNGDGQNDLIVIGEWTGIGFFKNSNGNFVQDESKKSLLEQKGWWYTIIETELNDDGQPDYILGNVGLNLKFKTSSEKPFKVYATDFDDNGSNDIVLTKQYNGEYVPVRGRECSSQQMPFIKEKFKTYEEFAKATLTDIYGEKLSESFYAETNTFESIALISDTNFSYTIETLPIEAQMFPLLSIAQVKPEQESGPTFILAGNIYETEVETPRLDAFSCVGLRYNDKQHKFEIISNQSIGIFLPYNVKQLLTINTNDHLNVLVGINDGPLKLYEHINDQ